MKKYSIYTVLIALITVFGCKEDEKLIFESITDGIDTAGGLRTIQLISPTIDLNDIENSEFSVEVEEWDDEDGGLLETVDVFVQFQDFTPDNGTNDKAEIQVTSLVASDFSNGPEGLPRATITVAASTIVGLLGLDPASEIDGGDVFRFRLALTLTNGSMFSSDNLEGNVTGPFFSSPFSYPANVVCNLDESLFTGNYQLEFVSGTFNAFGGSDAYADGQVTITANSGTQRVINNAMYLPSLGPFSVPITFDLVCGRTIVPMQVPGPGCTSGIVHQSGDNLASFDPSDDSEFTLIFNDEVTMDCGAPTYEVVLRFTKL